MEHSDYELIEMIRSIPTESYIWGAGFIVASVFLLRLIVKLALIIDDPYSVFEEFLKQGGNKLDKESFEGYVSDKRNFIFISIFLLMCFAGFCYYGAIKYLLQ